MKRYRTEETGNLSFNMESDHGYLEAQVYAGPEAHRRSIEVRFCSRFSRAEFNDVGDHVFGSHAAGSHDDRFHFHPHQVFSGIETVRGIRDSLNELIAFYETDGEAAA